MARSYRKQPVWKDHNCGMKARANRRVRRALKRDYTLDLRNRLYKRYFPSWDISDYCFLESKTFEEYHKRQILIWNNRKQCNQLFRGETEPTREELYREWLRSRNK